MPPLTTVYATDEDVCVRATGDFVVLCPDWQKQAYGKDGVFASGDPWTLTSATVDFGAAGVAAGMVVSLTQPKTTFKGSGDLLAVDAVAGSSVTLRRIGAASGLGSPPGPAAGVTGVEFTVPTMAPQIEEASYSLNRQWNIDANLPGRSPTDMYELRDLREATVLTVLLRRYTAENRADQGDFRLKIDQTSQALNLLVDRLSIRWGPTGTDPPETTIFSARLVR
jgi:hypothetical protein